LTFLTGTGRHRAQIAHFFRGQIGSWRSLGASLVVGSRLHRIRHRCDSLVLPKGFESKQCQKVALACNFYALRTRRNGTARCPRMLPGPRTCYRTSRAQKTRRVLVRGSGSTMNRHTHIAATKTQRAENEGRGRHTHTTDTLRARCDGRRERSGQRAPDSI